MQKSDESRQIDIELDDHYPQLSRPPSREAVHRESDLFETETQEAQVNMLIEESLINR